MKTTAVAFALALALSALSSSAQNMLAGIRTTNASDPKGPFLYSTPISMPNIGNTDFLFVAQNQSK